MLNALVNFSLRYRGVVITLACMVIAYGLYVAGHTRMDVFPEFSSPQVVIQTEAPGLSPQEVEQLVTRPIENALNGTPNLETIRSQSIQGLSAVTLVFTERADIYHARQMVNERLNGVSSALPHGVKPPQMGPLTSSACLTLAIGLTSSNLSAMDLRTFADWTLRPRLLGVPGVAKVDVFGGEVREIQIQIRPDRLQALNLSLDDVLAAARKSTAVRGAGFVENANQRVTVRAEGQFLTPEEMGEVLVAFRQGFNIRLKDVADVAYGAEPKFGDALVMGQRGVVVLSSSQYGANTLDVTAALEHALEEIKPALATEHIILHPRLFRPATFIENSLANITHSLLIGGILVVVVLFLFLLDLRIAFISFTAIPLSLLTAIIVLDRCGVSLNTITLGGFAIAIGVVVDDAIIDVENILRRVRENLTLPTPRPLFDVVLDASIEVRSAVVYATFIVALVFVPILTMTGIQGRLFSPLGIAFILAILASLGVALTVTPALCLAMLSRTQPHSEPRYVSWMKRVHSRCLHLLSQWPKTVITLAIVICVGGAATLPFFGGEFLPEFKEGHYIVHMAAYPGTSLDESLRIGKEVADELLKNPHIISVAQQAGRAENGEDTFGTHYSELHVELAPLGGEEMDAVSGEMRTALLKFPGLSFKIMPFLIERIEETLSGATAAVVVNIFGEDLNVLDQKAEEVRRTLAAIPGAVDAQMESQPGAPEFVVRLQNDRLLKYGFTPVEVLDAIETGFQGADVAQTYQGNRVINVTVILPQSLRRDPEQIGAMLLRSSAGARIPLRELAEIYPSTGRGVIVHQGAQRRQQVTCNVQGRDIASFVAEARKQVAAKVEFPHGVYPAFGGSAEAQSRARQELLMHSLMAGIGIVVLLAMVFGWGRNLWLVLANLPFALVGGALAVFASGGLLSIGSLVGFVTLFGITMRNSIIMISHFDHLVREEKLSWGLETAIRGASERLLPVVMTALVTGLGLLPLALGAEEAGREIEGPMAIVILGGLLTSTLLNLFVLPTLAWRFGRFGSVAADVRRL